MSALSREDLRAALEGAEGEHLSRDLLPKVNTWLECEGRQPVDVKTLGEAIRRELCLESRRYKGSTVWIVTPAALAGRDWFTETS